MTIKILPWRKLKKSWSVWLLSVGIMFNAFVNLAPDAWHNMPLAIKAQFSDQTAGQITLALYVLTFVARVIKQKDLQ